jgi:hypothetical protein
MNWYEILIVAISIAGGILFFALRFIKPAARKKSSGCGCSSGCDTGCPLSEKLNEYRRQNPMPKNQN